MSRCKLFNFSMSIGISGINEAFLGARRNIRIIDGDILYVGMHPEEHLPY